MKLGDKVILFGFIDGCSYETTGQTNFIIALETGERVEIPFGGAINVDEIVFKDNIKLKDVIKRIKGFDDGTKFKWTYDILKELGSDFCSKMFHEAYQQGKLEGEWVGQQLKDADKIRQELNKPVIPQFIDEFITEQKKLGHTLSYSIDASMSDIVAEWYWDNPELFALAWIFGYTVEEEKRYLVKVVGMDSVNGYLSYNKNLDKWFFGIASESKPYRAHHTRKELEEAGFGWVFDCEGVEVQEVE